jgi:hypothetical protein
MANRHRGEIEARLDGVTHRLVLTLGALAELEHAFGDDDMLALATRFEKGRLSARDCVRVIAAGLRGAGEAITDENVASMQADGGAAGYVDIVARLLNATFGGEATPQSPKTGGEGGADARVPFAGGS